MDGLTNSITVNKKDPKRERRVGVGVAVGVGMVNILLFPSSFSDPIVFLHQF